MKKLVIMLLLGTFCGVFASEGKPSVSVPTVAVLPFDARDRQAENVNSGKSVAELLAIALMATDCAELVERAELDKAFNELQLSAAGLTDKESQLKLGKLIGAKILITGSLFKSGDKNYIVAKIIGTETSRVLGSSVSSSEEFTSLVPELAKKVAAQIEKNSVRLLPKTVTLPSVTVKLSEVVKGDKRKVYVAIKEDINVSTLDPAAEIELKKLMLALGFEMVKDRSEADFSIIGEAVAANAGSYQKFISASARVELSVFGKDKKLLSAGAAKETLAGATYVIAAKDAIAQATLRLAGELCSVMK